MMTLYTTQPSTLPDQLWPGDHVRLNGRTDAFFAELKKSWIYKPTGKWYDGHVWIFTDAERAMIQLESIKTFEVVARPEVFFTDFPDRGTWFWQWYTQAEPCASMFWELTGPYANETYSIATVSLHDVGRHVASPHRPIGHGGINNIFKIDGRLVDRYGCPIPFFIPSFLPASLTFKSKELTHQRRLL